MPTWDIMIGTFDLEAVSIGTVSCTDPDCSETVHEDLQSMYDEFCEDFQEHYDGHFLDWLAEQPTWDVDID